MTRNRWHDTRKIPRKGDSLSGGVLFGTRPKKNPVSYTHLDVYKRQGYYQAFQAVRGTIADILKGKNAGEAVRADHPVSYTHLDNGCHPTLAVWRPYIRSYPQGHSGRKREDLSLIHISPLNRHKYLPFTSSKNI